MTAVISAAAIRLAADLRLLSDSVIIVRLQFGRDLCYKSTHTLLDAGVVVLLVGKIDKSDRDISVGRQGIERSAVQPVGLADAAAQQHAVHGMALFLLGHCYQELYRSDLFGDPATECPLQFSGVESTPYHTYRIGIFGSTPGKESGHKGTVAQFLAFVQSHASRSFGKYHRFRHRINGDGTGYGSVLWFGVHTRCQIFDFIAADSAS